MFHNSYQDSRAAFLDVVNSLGGRVRSKVLAGETGRDGEILAMDVGTIGDEQARKALVIVCGTHGLEGPAGSAIQRAFLDQMNGPPPSVKVVAVHALNPWGFSHQSRTDHVNIDPNRNFVDFAKFPPPSDAYSELHGRQCPEVWTDDVSTRLWDAVGMLVQDKGLDHVLSGMTSGQYQQPDGLNYGGQAPGWPRTAFSTVTANELRGCDKIAYIEWHTGFGQYGEMFHVVTHPAGSEELDRVAEWWGRDKVSRNGDAIEGAGGATPQWRGLLLNALPTLLPDADVAGAVIECGTYGNQEVLEALMIDRWLKFGRENRSSQQRHELEQQKFSVFCPTDSAWRARVEGDGVVLTEQAFAGLVDW